MEKNFGKSNGLIYNYRNDRDYHNLTIKMDDGYSERNEFLKSKFHNYIDMIGYVQQPDVTVRVFTDDDKFISQDCLHLTKAGAKFYANIIDWKYIINKCAVVR